MAWNNQEFAALFSDLYPKLCRFLECMLGGSGSAQEVAQEAFMKLYHKGGGMQHEDARFWIFRVARNLALNELKRSRTRTNLIDRVRAALHPKAIHPQEQYERAEEKRIVLGLLASLPEHQRSALLLREQQELSYAEIAVILNISEAKAKVDIHRARMSLRTRWKEDYETPKKAAR